MRVLSWPPRPMWPEKKSPKPASASPPHWNAERKSPAMPATKRSQAQKWLTKGFARILIRLLPSASGLELSSAISSPAGVHATRTDFDIEYPLSIPDSWLLWFELLMVEGPKDATCF